MSSAERNPEPATGTRNPEPGTRNVELGTWNLEPGTLDVVVFRERVGARDAFDDDREAKPDEDGRRQQTHIDSGPDSDVGSGADRSVLDDRARLRLRPCGVSHRARHPLISEKD